MSEPTLDIRVLELGDMTVVGLEGDLAAETAGRLTEEVLRALERESTVIVLDCSLLESLTADGSEALIDVADSVRAHHGRFMVRQPPPSARRVLELTGASAVIEFTD